MVSSILCLFLGISAIIFAGVPIAYYLWCALDKKGVSHIEFWTIVMFSGISFICVLVKILFMLNIPVAKYGKPLYILLFIFFAIFLWSKRKDMVVQNYFKVPIVLVSGMLVYGLNSIAYILYGILYGAKYYKGYAWWDLHYYGTQAEAMRTIPFEQWGELVEQKIWMIGATSFTSGTHRISLGSLGALVAELAGEDGPSATGFWFAISSLLLFFSIMYATEGMFTSRIKQCVVCIFAVMLPGVVTSKLECFYPVAFFVSFLIFYCRCFFDYYRQGGIRRVLLIGMVVSVGITFLLDGTYVLCGLIFTSVVWILHTKEQFKCRENIKKITGIVLALSIAIVLNVQYLPYLWKELHSNSGVGALESYKVLNGIYEFAYLPSMPDWIFYGAQFGETIPKLFVWLLTFVAVILFICGICGLIMQIIKKHDGICFNFLAVFGVALLFYSKPGENQYVFFKVLHFSFVPIAIGVFLFIEYVRREFDRQRVVFKFYYHFVSVTVYAVFSLCMLYSLGRELAVVPQFQKWSGRVVGHEVISEQAREIYRKIEYGDSPILLVCSGQGQDIVMWWASYYGRNRDVYVMAESELCHYLRTTNPNAPYIAPDSIASMECEIVNLGNATQSVFPEQKREDYAIYLEREDDMGNKMIADYIYSPEQTAKNYSLFIFAREEVETKLCISTDIDGTFSCNGREVKVQDNKLEITMDLKKGVNKIPISNADIDFKITEYSLNILQ